MGLLVKYKTLARHLCSAQRNQSHPYWSARRLWAMWVSWHIQPSRRVKMASFSRPSPRSRRECFFDGPGGSRSLSHRLPLSPPRRSSPSGDRSNPFLFVFPISDRQRVMSNTVQSAASACPEGEGEQTHRSKCNNIANTGINCLWWPLSFCSRNCRSTFFRYT